MISEDHAAALHVKLRAQLLPEFKMQEEITNRLQTLVANKIDASGEFPCRAEDLTDDFVALAMW